MDYRFRDNGFLSGLHPEQLIARAFLRQISFHVFERITVIEDAIEFYMKKDKLEERSKMFEEVHKKACMMTEEENLRENIRLQEMGFTLRKNRSGLPVNLYLDDSATYKLGGITRE